MKQLQEAKLTFILFLTFVLARAQKDSTDVILQNIMKAQKTPGLSLAVVKYCEVLGVE